MGRSKSSKRWLAEQFDDVYVKRAQKEGRRSLQQLESELAGRGVDLVLSDMAPTLMAW